MEIRVEQRLTGRDLRDDVLRRHGSREALERAAEGGDVEAQDDLATLHLMDERPGRLDEVFEVQEVSRLTVPDLASLSGRSLRVLAFLIDHPGATKTEVAVGLDMAWGAVAHHLHRLERLGLVRVQRVGRAARCTATPGLDIHITTPSKAAEAEA